MRFRLKLGFVMWAMTALASASDSFAERLAALQNQLATRGTNLAALYQLGRLCYDRGAEGDHKAVDLAEKYFRQILGLDEKQALARALLGSTITMKARDSFWPPTRMAYAHAGIKEMDAAVQMAPENAEVRFVRAENNFHMPKFMGREAIVKADLAWLWEKVRAKPEAFKPDLAQSVALLQGRLLKREKQKDEAVKAWQWGLAVDPASSLARELREQLDHARAHEK